ncbi:MAG: hypothetical protein R3A51_04975 [Nannocystaceae bacterium]|nr:hypothetical protein [Myxococcales bacterium]
MHRLNVTRLAALVVGAASALAIGAACGPDASALADQDDQDEDDALEDDRCAQAQETRSCSDGVQWCDSIDGALHWGPCVPAPDCELGVTETCEDAEAHVSRVCELQGGVPTWSRACPVAPEPNDLVGESCEDMLLGTSRECDGGLQWCDAFLDGNAWGPCVAAPECELGVEESCDSPEREVTRVCELHAGVPAWNEQCPPGPDEDLEGESCPENWLSRQCGEGVQWCTYGTGGTVWGPCVLHPECEPGEVTNCNLGEGFEDWTTSCLLQGGVPMWDWNACSTPLVLVFDDAPVRLAEASATPFDLSGVGSCMTTDWPTEATPWLAIDLDRNGAIDGAHELFGSATRLASGRLARDGFAALRELDSDRDGQITARDEAFDGLVLWVDLDGDRRGQLSELEPLRDRGVTALDLAYTVDPRCDARGNCEVERSAFRFERGGLSSTGALVDVHLACQ